MFYIVGIGPGAKEYMLPQALETVKMSDLLIGGKRNLALFSELGKDEFPITADLNALCTTIRKEREKKSIAVLASGDPTFYSITSFLLKNFSRDEMKVIPGISSFQYMAARCCMVWNGGNPISMHGLGVDLESYLTTGEPLFILTDRTNTPQAIARRVVGFGQKERRIFVGTDLSYENEKIISASALETSRMELVNPLSVVIIDGI